MDAGIQGVDAAQANAPPLAPVDLLHAVPARVAVSSRVNNRNITPFHLVDGDLDTAWNSRTGQLVGSWIAFRLPATARVDELQLTAGFVSRGDDGDYFTMNPRIKRIVVSRNGTKLVERDLDLGVRGLQSVPIGSTGGDYRIEVTAIEPGSKQQWREVCVSELRVMGVAPGMQPGGLWPAMSIGSLDTEPLKDDAIHLVVPSSYLSIADYCAEVRLRASFTVDRCGDKAEAPFAMPSPLPAGWTAHWFFETQSNKRLGVLMDDCHLALEANGRFYVLGGFGSSCGRAHDRVELVQPTRFVPSRAGAELVDIAGAPDEDLVLVATNGPAEVLVLCVPTLGGAPACNELQIQIAELEHHNHSGTAGWNEFDTYKWFNDYSFSDGVLDLGPEAPRRPLRVIH